MIYCTLTTSCNYKVIIWAKTNAYLVKMVRCAFLAIIKPCLFSYLGVLVKKRFDRITKVFPIFQLCFTLMA